MYIYLQYKVAIVDRNSKAFASVLETVQIINARLKSIWTYYSIIGRVKSFAMKSTCLIHICMSVYSCMHACMYVCARLYKMWTRKNERKCQPTSTTQHSLMYEKCYFDKLHWFMAYNQHVFPLSNSYVLACVRTKPRCWPIRSAKLCPGESSRCGISFITSPEHRERQPNKKNEDRS